MPVTLRTPDSLAGRAPQAQVSLLIDLLIVGVIVAFFGGFLAFGSQWARPHQNAVAIDRSLGALPWYTLLTVGRGFAAYAVSLLFAITYGPLAAHSPRAEKIMIPALDVLQGVPVLAFLPGLVLGLVRLFPSSNIGLELACVLAIFTGQAWNMAFSINASIRTLPAELVEISRLHRFGWWRRFARVELPGSMIGLVWNSMLSMASGWFFLTVVESFTIKDRETGAVLDFRLPGVGSYMNEAYDHNDRAAMTGACIAMLVVVVGLDQLLWRPLIAWAQKFKLDETDTSARPASWVYDLVRRSRLAAWIGAAVRRRRGGERAAGHVVEGRDTIGLVEETAGAARLRRALVVAACAVLGLLALRGAWELAKFLGRLSLGDWLEIVFALGLTALRVVATVAISVAWTVPAGLAIGRSPALARVVQPIIQSVASFPFPMIYPLIAGAIVATGVSFEVGCVALLLLGAQWYVLFNVVAGATAIPQDLREVASLYGLRGTARLLKVELSGIFPHLVTGLVTAAGGAWNASVVSEFVVMGKGADEPPLVAHGIGSYLWQAFSSGEDHKLAAGVLVLSVFLIVLNRFLWHPLFRLSDERFALNR